MARDFSTINSAGNSRRAAYVVFEGRKPGIYATWEETKEQVHRFSGQSYKGFDS
ncbi:RNase H1/viroplasmin domain-containing protein [Alteromonas gilva]|uniref:RNase H1/viroplasmin domain-containing protein n=1 Tax=Alteromonas gilva TaxID=2987522 RepID=A0ABT5L6J2_9ALTE|nr:RNase H1/viroplasmin domain-containing protein [Alteromonas gilva]MDC8832498.1 RNase H1/viroplasmin domain-containing protein [Alteromonas gilva]